MKKVVALLCLAAACVYAQGNTSLLDGTVIDQTGAAVPGAQVTVTNLATDQTFKATTNDRGEWALPSMTSAAYKVVVNKAGFKAGVAPNVQMSAGVPATVNIKL